MTPIVDVIYSDLAKAFDKVSHVRLLRILEAHGIAGLVLSWIKAWLSDRNQRVVLNGEFSEWEPVPSGVPQGSVLGPTLFVLYINPLDLSIGTDIKILSKFADDTKIGGDAGAADRVEVIQTAVDKAAEWADRWQMKFNADKCTVIHFGRNNNQHDYTMGGRTLQKEQSEKDLGVYISNDLKPSVQCQKAAKKANGVLGRMARSLTYRNKDTWLKLYAIYVRPILEYSVQAWNPWLQKDINALEKVQRRAVRMTSGLQAKTYEEKLVECGMTTLEERRVRGDMIQTWKVLNRYDNVDEKLWFERVDTEREISTRLSSCTLNLKTRNCNLDTRKYSFSQRVVAKWNSLPESVKESATLNMFKNNLDNFISDNI